MDWSISIQDIVSLCKIAGWWFLSWILQLASFIWLIQCSWTVSFSLGYILESTRELIKILSLRCQSLHQLCYQIWGWHPTSFFFNLYMIQMVAKLENQCKLTRWRNLARIMLDQNTCSCLSLVSARSPSPTGVACLTLVNSEYVARLRCQT